MHKITNICSLLWSKIIFLNFSLTFQKKYFPLSFPHFSWPHKFPDFFQFFLTCRNPETTFRVRFLGASKIATTATWQQPPIPVTETMQHCQHYWRALKIKAQTSIMLLPVNPLAERSQYTKYFWYILCLKKTGTPPKVIVSRIQAHKIKWIFYAKNFKPILGKSWNF